MCSLISMKINNFTNTKPFFGHSSVFQLLEKTYKIARSIEDCCMLLFCDLSNAFDIVWHEGLFFKHKTYRIKGNILHEFISYLCNRSQRVIFKYKLSSTL